MRKKPFYPSNNKRRSNYIPNPGETKNKVEYQNILVFTYDVILGMSYKVVEIAI